MPTCDELVTKLELEELKDKINRILGAKGDGTDYENVLDEPNIVLGLTGLGGAGLTGSALWLQNAFNSINDIKLEKTGEKAIWKELKDGTAKITSLRGNGIQKEMPALKKLGQVAGAGVEVAAQAAATAGNAAAAVNLLATLVNIGMTLALNKITVDVFDKRIEAESKLAANAVEQVNNNMLKLYQKNAGSIGAINGELDGYAQKFNDQSVTNQSIKNEVAQQKTDLTGIKETVAEQQAVIDSLIEDNLRLYTELSQFQTETEEQIEELTDLMNSLRESLSTVTDQLQQAQETIAEQGEYIADLEALLANHEERITSLEATIVEQGEEIERLKAEFTQLDIDLNSPVIINPSPKAYRLVQLFRHEETHKAGGAGGGGGGAAVANREAAKQQAAVLKLSNKLSDAPIVIPTIHDYDIPNGTSPFNNLFEQLLDTINPNEVKQEQIDALENNLGTKFELALLAGLTANVIPKLDNITNQTTSPAISNAVQSGICQSLNGGGCPPTPGNPNPTQGLQGANNALHTRHDALNTALGVTDLAQGATILSIVRNTNQVINHAEHGLAKVQSFATTAWRATHADKILNVIGTAASIHNAAMLSKALGVTIAETASTVLDAAGIQDEKGEAFDVGAIIKAKLNAMISHLVGEENYAAFTKKIAAYNRIYQAGANVLTTVTGLIDGARAVNELTGAYTGKIGNALLNAGVVADGAYDRMLENMRPSGRIANSITRYREGVETIEDKVSNVDNVASEVRETKEEYKELGDSWKDWEKANKDAKVIIDKDVEDVKKVSETVADPELEHFQKDTSED